MLISPNIPGSIVWRHLLFIFNSCTVSTSVNQPRFATHAWSCFSFLCRVCGGIPGVVSWMPLELRCLLCFSDKMLSKCKCKKHRGRCSFGVIWLTTQDIPRYARWRGEGSKIKLVTLAHLQRGVKLLKRKGRRCYTNIILGIYIVISAFFIFLSAYKKILGLDLIINNVLLGAIPLMSSMCKAYTVSSP